jgi:peptide deformylase
MNIKNKLIYFPDKRLLTQCSKIKDISEEIKNISMQMAYDLKYVQGFYKDKSLAISANQVGENVKLVLMLKYPEKKQGRHTFHYVMMNPEIIKLSQELSVKWEGCISDIESVYLKKRPKYCTIKFTNKMGEEETLECDELQSRVMQHEIDHLEGLDFREKYEEKISIPFLQRNKFQFNKWILINQEKNLFI